MISEFRTFCSSGYDAFDVRRGVPEPLRRGLVELDREAHLGAVVRIWQPDTQVE